MGRATCNKDREKFALQDRLLHTNFRLHATMEQLPQSSQFSKRLCERYERVARLSRQSVLRRQYNLHCRLHYRTDTKQSNASGSTS